MAVIAAGELYELTPFGISSCEPQSAHCRLGAGVDQAEHFNVGHKFYNLLRQPDFRFRGGAETCPIFGCLLNGGNDLFVSVAEDTRPP